MTLIKNIGVFGTYFDTARPTRGGTRYMEGFIIRCKEDALVLG